MTKSDRSGNGRGLRDVGSWARLHLWEIQPVRDVLLIFALFGILWAGHTASVVTVPLLLALLLAYLFEPLVRRFARGSAVRRRVAAGGVILGVVVLVIVPVILGLIWAATSAVNSAAVFRKDVIALSRVVRQETPPTEEELDAALPRKQSWHDFALYLRELDDRASMPTVAGPSVAKEPEDLSVDEPPTGPPEERVAEAFEVTPEVLGRRSTRELLQAGINSVFEWAGQNQADLTKRAAKTGLDVLSLLVLGAKSIGQVAFGGFLTAFFFFFICSGYEGVLKFLRDLIPDGIRPRALHLASRMDRVVAGFVRGRITICAVLSVLFTIGYAIIGAPVPFVLGLATGVLSVVPYLAMVAVPVAMMLMFLDPSEGVRGTWWWIIGSPIVLYVVVQTADDYLLTPRIQGKQTDMDTPSILFAALAGAALLGVYGLLIAIPLAACAKIMWIEIVVPRIKEWKAGRASDPLPLGGDSPKG